MRIFAVLAEELEHGAGRRILWEDAADSVGPGCAHGLEAVEDAQVLGGDEGRVHAAEDVVEELGVEALHVCVEVCGCAGAGSNILYFVFCILYFVFCILSERKNKAHV
jgi:hypothetical protein